MRGNCLFYAVRQWWRDPEHIYLIIRPSRSKISIRLPWLGRVHLRIFHVLVTESIEGVEIKEFEPVVRLQGWRMLLDAPWFRGRVREGIGEEKSLKERVKRHLHRVRVFKTRRSSLEARDEEKEV